MTDVDVLIATALEMERDAVRDAAMWLPARRTGVKSWQAKDMSRPPEYLLGEYQLSLGGSIKIALALPTRMGGRFTSTVVDALLERLNPYCLAMCGVCAGNPADVALGDVVIASTVFQYDEGKRTNSGFQGDIFSTPMDIYWLQQAKDLRPDGLPSYGIASEADATFWLLERLLAGASPTTHPARNRYFPDGSWKERIEKLEQNGLLGRNGRTFVVTNLGKEFIDSKLAYSVDPPSTLPFRVVVGPMASGNAVVKDGITWDMLKSVGQRSAIALEMEAASIGAAGYSRGLSKWIVVKGVMDHADPEKDDRYKPFAARASAEVLLRFLETSFTRVDQIRAHPQVKGSRIKLTVDTTRLSHQLPFEAEWLNVQHDLQSMIDDHYCANLVATEGTQWRKLIDDLIRDTRRPISIVDLHDPEARGRGGLVKSILWNFGIEGLVPLPPKDLIELSRQIKIMKNPLIVLLHFDFVREWSSKDRRQVLSAFAFFVERKQVSILLHSRESFQTLIPREHWVSPFRPGEIRLKM
jgi:nucleoside phosphorylase